MSLIPSFVTTSNRRPLLCMVTNSKCAQGAGTIVALRAPHLSFTVALPLKASSGRLTVRTAIPRPNDGCSRGQGFSYDLPLFARGSIDAP